MTKEKLAQILEQHQIWLTGKGGVKADFSNSDLRDADLSGINLRGVNLVDTDLRGVNLSDADLRGVNLRGSSLHRANLSNANLSSSDLRVASFNYANLSGANLSFADLSVSSFYGANLQGVDLSYAGLRGVDFRNANLRSACLRSANHLGSADFCNADLTQCTLSDGSKYEEWLPTIQSWLEVPKLQIYGWPDGARLSVGFVPSYPGVALEFEMSDAGVTRFFMDDEGGLFPVIESDSKISRVFSDMDLIEESAAEEGVWICPTSEEIELRRLLDEPHPLLLPFEELKAWMLSLSSRGEP